MAGVLDRIGWPQKKALENSFPALRVDRRTLELQTAKEILAEIFGVSISEIEKTLLNRYDEACYRDNSPKEWPREFWVGENVD